MKSFSFGKEYRIKSRGLFELIFEKGKKEATSALVLWHLNASDFPQLKERSGIKLGLIVSKKTGSAVARNRIKRLLRESLRKEKGALKEGLRIVLYPKPGFKPSCQREVAGQLKKMLDKARLYK